MKKQILLISIFTIQVFTSFCADNYKIGDELFIWAKSGLNLRKGPGTNFSIVSKLKFGDKVTIQEKMDKTYNVVGISKIETQYYSNESIINPVVFRGNWVKIVTISGIAGFVIDQYLLRVEPISIEQTYFQDLNLKLISCDTTFKRPEMLDGEALNVTVEKKYTNGIFEVENFGGVYFQEVYTFSNFTIEEVLIIFSAINNDYQDYVVYRNWKEEVVFNDSDTCTFTVKKIGDKVVVTILCAC